MIFPTHMVARAGPLPARAERLAVETPQGETLHGLHIPPRSAGKGAKTLVLGFAGNAWNGQDAAEYLHQVYPGEHVVVFHYRGYAPSTGSPSAEALLADAPLVYDAAVANVRPERVVAVGFSIGSGVAAGLARSRKLDGLILVTPFDSLKAVAEGHYPWVPVGMLFAHELDAAGLLKGTKVPVAILAAGDDTLIPPRRTEALRKRVPTLVFDRTIAGAGHNDIYHRSDFQAAMREALGAVAGPG